MIKQAVILAGGKGERLAPYTTVLPKPLLPVGDLPILEIVIRQLKSHGITEIIICVGYLGSLLQAYFGNGEKWGVNITYSFESQPLGTAGPLALIQGLTGPFLMMNGDLLTTIDYSDMIRAHQKSGRMATIGLAKKTVKIDLGVIESHTDGTLKNYIEKPVLDYLVSMGIYVFNPEVLNFVPRGVRLDLPNLILNLVAAGQPVQTYHRDYLWLDIGRHEDYAAATEAFTTRKAEFLPERGH